MYRKLFNETILRITFIDSSKGGEFKDIDY